ncbi:unnamed protein product [Adineta ricciae]|uniref:Very-long-chain 3-oxoacyl-CoA synthase n=1 Tax=Adineta ricciae TaxID=249248 RepID=A0A815HQA1_ADIRI|nr:unnamed protein product [Adineta ricciae]
MVTLASHISDYFEQFNSSLTNDFNSNTNGLSTDNNLRTYYVFDFERYSDKIGTLSDLRTFMIQRWHNSFFYAIAYLLLIYAGQMYMKNKPRFELRLWLAAWSSLLAIFSIFGALRVLPELIFVIYRQGIKDSICNNSNAFGVVGFWTWAFCFSKLPELIDTVFIVLRKQPLIFLHWYHHASVLVYCWFSYQDYSSTGRWFCGLNYVVHGVMYSYYAFRALRFRIPRWISMIITMLQLTQMVVGCWINLKAWQYKKNGEICQVTDENLKNVRLFKNEMNLTIASKTTHEVTAILNELVQDYQAHIRPRFGDGPTRVYADILVNSFGPIQEIDMSYTINCYFRQRWRDERLQFAEHVGVLSLSTRMLERLWKPDTVFYNSKHSFLHSIPTSNRLWRLFPDGTIWYSSRITVKAKCSMNLKNFPVDTQICQLFIGSFANSASDIHYSWRLGNNKSVNFDGEVLLSQFDLIQYPQYNEIISIDGRNFSVLRVDFVLKRHMGYYIIQVYIPSSMLVMLSWVSFFIHREATADRVNIAAMSVLSLTTLSFDIRNHTATVSYLTALDWFVIMSHVFLFASLIQFAFVHYFTKFGYGEPLIRLQDSFDNEILTNDSMLNARSSIIYSDVANIHGKSKTLFLSSSHRYFYRFWFCLSGNTDYKRSIRKRTSRFGVNSRSDLDVYARIGFIQTPRYKRLIKLINDCHPNIQWSNVEKTIIYLRNQTEPYQRQYSPRHIGIYWEFKVPMELSVLAWARDQIIKNRPEGFLPSELKIYWNYHQIESLTTCKFYNTISDTHARHTLLTWPVNKRKNQGTIDYITTLIHHALIDVPKGKQAIVLDFADERIPGGDFLEGVYMQEQHILYHSTGYRALLDLKYRMMGGGYFIPEFGVLYVKNVQFFRASGLLTRCADLIVAACYDLTGDRGLYRLPSPRDEADIRSRTLRKFRAIIASAVANSEKDGSDTYLLLGPIGTGAFNNSMEMIASLFAEVLNNSLMNSDGPIRYAFDKIWFVSYGDLDVFKNTFEGY